MGVFADGLVMALPTQQAATHVKYIDIVSFTVFVDEAKKNYNSL
jgi:hypothetical protein